VHRRTVADAPTHDRAPGARVPMHSGTPCCAPVLPAVLVLPRVHDHAPLSHTRVLRCFPRFAILDARGFLEPPIFLEITLEVFCSVETR